jgi:hypothetical protein
MANVMMATYTTCNNGKLMYLCNKCHSNQKKPRNAWILDGNISYDGIISFNEYLKYEMTALFSPFTLYKPYLILMYDLHQPLQFIKETFKTCLAKDMKTCKIRNPKMTKQDVINKLLNTILLQRYKALFNGAKHNYKIFYAWLNNLACHIF